MRRFADETGREWLVRVDVSKLKRWRDQLGIDFAQVSQDGFASIFGDQIRFAQMMYQTCRTQSEQAGVTEESFLELMAGDTLESAQEAWMLAVVDFFPSREGRKKMLASLAEVRASQKESGRESPGAPGSSASTLTATPSAS
ncbi:MAG: hypothetical protein U0840_25685 [Gemmataceae bacterium]